MRWAPGTPLFEEGRGELREVLQQLRAMGVPESRYALNLSIARGLDYYTGIVYETTLDALSADRLDLFGRPLRRPRQPLHASRSCPASGSPSA